MLLAGGNAFDALVAAGFAAAVVEPIASYSLAAEGVFMLYDSASGGLLSLSGQGTAPGKATADFYLSRGHERPFPPAQARMLPCPFTLPGVVDAFISLLDRYGTMDLVDVIAPAITYAAEGIPNYEYMLERLKSSSGQRQFNKLPARRLGRVLPGWGGSPRGLPVGAARPGQHLAGAVRRLIESPGRPLPAYAGRPPTSSIGAPLPG